MKALKILVLALLLSGCTKDENCKILLLRVDYTTNTFEGGHEQILAKGISDSDSIPIKVEYVPPLDFGNIRLLFEPTGETIFNGSIIWHGTGKITYPKSFLDPNKYSTLSNPIDLPGISQIQYLHNYMNDQFDYSYIWESINDIEIVSEYLKSHKKIAIFLYTPGVGADNPKTWDWFVIMNK